MASFNKLILGTVQIGVSGYGINNSTKGLAEKESLDILSLAYNSGITTLDTAVAYGKAEKIIGKHHAENPNSSFRVITKIHPGDGVSVQDALFDSLNNLNQSGVDTLLFHSFDDFLRKKNSITDLLKEIEKGRIKNIGVSVYTDSEARALLKYDYIDIIQLPFNLLDNLSLKGDLLEDIKLAGKSVHVRSVFLQGLFFKNLDLLPVFLEPLRLDLELLHSLSKQYQISMNQMAMRYVLDQPLIDGVLIGVDSLAQLEENLDQIKNPLPEALMARINGIKPSNQLLLNPVLWK